MFGQGSKASASEVRAALEECSKVHGQLTKDAAMGESQNTALTKDAAMGESQNTWTADEGCCHG